MSHLKVKLSLVFNYIIFAILLNSVGVVILQLINDFGINPESASIVEAYKDLSVAIASFLLAAYIPNFGYKRSMITGLLIVSAGSIFMALFGSFGMSKILYAMVGVSFALIKISAYSTVSLITIDSSDHASFMSTLEGFYMVGVLSGFWLFGYIIDIAGNYESVTWLSTYWILTVISGLATILMISTDLDESCVKENISTPGEHFTEMIKLIKYPLVITFVLGAFFYVYIEQAINTWLPTFNYQILQLPESISVQIASIYAGTLAAGRLIGGWIMKRVHWYVVLQTCIVIAATLILLVLPLTGGVEPGSVLGWSNVPLAAYLFPAIGLFLAPIYPTLSSSVLSALPKNRQSGMTGLIIIFSALGGTSGSIITGFLFGRMDGQVAFYFTLVPLVILFLILIVYKRQRESFQVKN